MAKRIIKLFVISIFFLQVFSFAFGAPIVIYGDSRNGHKAHRRVVSAILKFKPSVVFHLGDFVNFGSSKYDWQIFDEITAELSKTAEFYPVAGNHERDSAMFFRRFKLPQYRAWYSVERDGIHFVILDNNFELSEGSPQYKWLEEDLKNISNKVQFRVVLMHYPFFSVIRKDGGYRKLRAALLPLFKKYRVNIVFSGHDHSYQRFFRDDIYYVVTGGGGAPLYGQKYFNPYLKKFFKGNHFCVLTVEGKIINVKVLDTGLNLIDEFKVPTENR